MRRRTRARRDALPHLTTVPPVAELKRLMQIGIRERRDGGAARRVGDQQDQRLSSIFPKIVRDAPRQCRSIGRRSAKTESAKDAGHYLADFAVASAQTAASDTENGRHSL